MSASQYNVSSQVGLEVLKFPVQEDLVNFTSEIQPLVAKIPPEVIQERLQSQGAGSKNIRDANFFCDTHTLLMTWRPVFFLGWF